METPVSMWGHRWGSSLAALALCGCGELLGIDTIESGPPSGGGAGTGADGGAGGAGGGAPLPETVEGRGCTTNDVCGDRAASCCESRLVSGVSLGEYPMGCSFVPGRPCNTESQGPEHAATIGDIYLDTFEATVGRFRQFQEEYNAWRGGGNPAPGAGTHPRIADSGWQAAWNELLPNGDVWFDIDLDCSPGFNSWRPDADARLPENCLSWPVAFAFCIWSGGRLPTEAEWEIAAAGATENRLYAWGIAKPAPELAVYNVDDMIPPESFWLENAGSRPLGRGRFGHLDLGGNLGEWTLDQYSTTWFAKGGQGNPCNDCANLGNIEDDHVLRGGSWSWQTYDLLVTARDDEPATGKTERFGVRCARDGAP